MLGNAPCDPANPCAAHDCWSRVMKARREPLLSTTIADLLAGASAITLPTARRDTKVAASPAA